MIDLNVKALVAMTYVTLPYMSVGGQIYQIDSMSAFQPMPYVNVYGATKAFVLSFSRALNVELRERAVRFPDPDRPDPDLGRRNAGPSTCRTRMGAAGTVRRRRFA